MVPMIMIYFPHCSWAYISLLQSSRWALVFRPKTSKTLFGSVHFSAFIWELYKNKFKNLIRTCKLKFSFRGLLLTTNVTIDPDAFNMYKLCMINIIVFLFLVLEKIKKKYLFVFALLDPSKQTDLYRIGWIVLYFNHFNKTWVICSFFQVKQLNCQVLNMAAIFNGNRGRKQTFRCEFIYIS